MKKISLFILVFSVLSTIFFLLLIFFRVPFFLYPLMSYQDALDILTPLVLIPIYWLLFRLSSKSPSSQTEEIAFMLLASVWVLGHGMHLAANSINNLAGALAESQVVDITGTDLYGLTYFFDENLSHYLWHVGILGLAGLLIYREWRQPSGNSTKWSITGLAGFIYGFTLFSIFLEGQTVPLGLPFVLIMVLLVLIWGRRKLTQQPILAFFFVAGLVALVIFTGWGLYWTGFPQFSEVGLI